VKKIIFFILISQSLFASELVEILPLTDRVIQLHFKDGFIKYAPHFDLSDREIIENNLLDTLKAEDPKSYRIVSPDDTDFSIAILPSSIGRKSRPLYVSGKCKWNGKQCDNTVVYEHYIFLELPKSMKRGKTYAVTMPGLAVSVKNFSIKFNEFETRSEAVHVNQIGYRPFARKKFAYVSYWMGSKGPLNLDAYSNTPFHVVSVNDKKILFSGKLKLRKRLNSEPEMATWIGPNYNFFGADLWECDFSSFQTPGEYIIVVERIGSSFSFRIDDDVYRKAFYTSIRGLYHQRSGIELSKPWADWVRPRCHNPHDGFKIAYSSFRYMDATTESAEKEVKSMKKGFVTNIWGWYQDAGDWDTYPSHFVIPRFLLTVYEFKPDNFIDNELNIPESGNGIPDIIDEASWQIRYLNRAKGPTGGIAGSRVEQYGKRPDGKDPHSFPSWQDTTEWIAFGEEPKASFGYVSLACQLAYCLDLFAKGKHHNSDYWISDAKKVYAWAEKNMRKGDDVKVYGSKMLADVWLYKVTGEKKYHVNFKKAVEKMPEFDPDATCNKDEMWAVWCYATLKRSDVDIELQNRLKSLAIKWADNMNLNPSLKRGARVGIHFYVPTLIGFNSTPHVMPSIVAYEITKDKKYLDVIETTCDYMLGGNALNICQVSGLGKRSPSVFLKVDARFTTNQPYPPGITLYSVFRPEEPLNWTGPWDANMFWAKVFPNWKEWPVHEGYADNPWNVMGNEYTVHQNIAPSAAVYGYLCGSKKD